MDRRFAVVAAVMLLAGCAAEPPGRTRSLGSVPGEQALDVAQGVLSRHFEIASVDRASGTITSVPTNVQAGGERLIGNSPARQIATLQIIEAKGQTIARLSIIQQRQTRDLQKVVPETDSYSGVPDRTPARSPGPGDVDMPGDWQNERAVGELETRILQEIFAALQPATLPGEAAPAD